ncbi:TonB-dependent receptor [Flavobacterium ovatum]|uniref:SusC/RagA family TonB-linked outer membrane protein n=1 Tax=Flavobacterium ovatum TaxID=1928857 RepID=UPI00344D361F
MRLGLFFKWKLKSKLLAILLIISVGGVQAQNAVNVTGVVKGDGDVLPGAGILIKGTKVGTVTDLDGNYKIKAKETDVLVFSYIGFVSQEFKVNKLVLNVTLKAIASSLDEVVVVGYGTQKKKEVTGSVAQLKGENLIQNSTSDLGQALQGQISGVNVIASSGEPGSESNISIRGLSSILGYNGPLYVVDGIPQDGNPNISNNEIETIDVLKDAASSAIYGTRGAGGVILITTKKGKEGKMKIKLDSYYGVQDIYSEMPKANFEEDIYIRFNRLQTLNGTFYNNSFTTFENNKSQFTNNTDLSNRLLVQNAPIQNHSLSVSGGGQGATYSVVGTYFNQEGSVINSGYDRFNIRANSQLKSGKWTVTTGFGARIENKQYLSGDMLTRIYNYFPYQPDVDPAKPVIDEVSANGTNNDAVGTSILNALIKREDNNKGNNFTGNLTIDFDLTKNLKFTSRSGIGYTNNNRIRINPSFKAYDLTGAAIPSQIRTSVYNYDSAASNYSIENIVSYKKSFGDHNINLLGVYSAEQYKFTAFSVEKYDIFENNNTTLNGTLADEAIAVSGPDRVNTLTGTLARFQYNYKGKYLLSLSARRDGSSRFSADNRFEIFPSISMGWNVSDEDFWKPYKGVANSFKLRLSHGTTGNQGLPDYSYSNTIALKQDYVFGNGSSQTLFSGASQTDFANLNVKWETSVQTNFGYDLSFLKSRLTLTADLYKTTKKNLLVGSLLPNSAGTISNGNNGTFIQNIGDMENLGVEYAVNYKSANKGKFNWNSAMTFSQNKNQITRLNGNTKISYLAFSTVVTGVPNEDVVSALALGHEAGSFYLLKTDGVINDPIELSEYNAQFPTLGAKLGDLKFVDALTIDSNGDGILDKGDGIIDNNDRQYAGSGTPDFEMGWNLGANYKNFDFSMQWYASFGAEVINGSKAAGYKYGSHRDLVYAWTPQNPDSNIPADRGRDYLSYRGYTDYWLEDGTFARLKNIAIGYSVPKKALSKLTISKLRFYLAAQNIITLTKYTGFDPEVGNNGLSTKGIDRGNYPITSQLRGGVQLEF